MNLAELNFQVPSIEKVGRKWNVTGSIKEEWGSWQGVSALQINC